MLIDHLADGDLVIVERRDSPVDGEAVVVNLDCGKTTIKRFYQSDSGCRLVSTMGDEESGEVLSKDPEIQGVVIGVVRKFG